MCLQSYDNTSVSLLNVDAVDKRSSSEGREKNHEQRHKDSVSMVILLHRHGARFPTKEMTHDLSWPSHDQFWDHYGANLTPIGSVQAYTMGVSLHKRYKGSSLFKDVKRCDVGKHVLVHTSNKHRTLFTAWNVLRGMFPGINSFFTYYSDRVELNMESIEKSMNERDETLGIPINVESQSKNDELLHQIKTSSVDAQRFKKKNVLDCPFYEKVESDPAYLRLLDKLYKMSEEDCFAPDKPVRERLAKVKKIANQLTIARVHNMPEFPNRHGIVLSDKEKSMVFKCAEQYWTYMYRPSRSNKVSDGIGKAGCGHLAGEVARLLKEHIEGEDDDIRFVEYSAHDTTILAMASFLGVDIVHPSFTGYFAFELRRPHDTGSEKIERDEWTVAVYYNDDPMQHGIDIKSRKLPLDGVFADFDKLPCGVVRARDLIAYMEDEGQMVCAKVLRQVGRLATALMKDKIKWADVLSMGALVEPKAKETFKDTFDFYDSDHSGAISSKELDTVFRKLGLDEIDHTTVQGLVDFFDRNHSNSLNFDEFLSMMAIVKQCCFKKSTQPHPILAACTGGKKYSSLMTPRRTHFLEPQLEYTVADGRKVSLDESVGSGVSLVEGPGVPSHKKTRGTGI